MIHECRRTVERKAARDVIGYCRLVDSGRGTGNRSWRSSCSAGYERLWATVWDWNTASRRVLAKLGFTETGRREVDEVHGTTLFTTRRL